MTGGLALALTLAFGVSRWASTEPDGLERAAADHALDATEQPHALGDGPFAGYSTRGVDDPGLATGLAGAVGVAITFAIASGLVWITSRASRRATHRAATTST